MANFTPVSAAIGGALIGLSVALLMLLSGRIAGISGILGESLSADTDKGWRLAFLAGLIAAPLVASYWLACWSASAPGWGRAARRATAFAGSRDCPLAR